MGYSSWGHIQLDTTEATKQRQHCIPVFNILRNHYTIFSILATHFTFTLVMCLCCSFSTFLSALIIFHIFLIHPNGCEVLSDLDVSLFTQAQKTKRN